MPTQLNPQEIYLLELFTSPGYFGELRDTWAEMVEHVESCLGSFMQNLPARYRARNLSDQPDIVWGNRVLPNFRDTLQGLNKGYILLTHGDVEGLSYAHGPRGDFKGQMDYWAGWMPKADQDQYEALMNSAVAIAHNIVLTEGAYWDPLDLTDYRNEWAPLKQPATWPTYRINKGVAIKSGEKTTQSGIYLPDVNNSCAQFLSTYHERAPAASVQVGFEDLLDPTTGEKYDQQPIFEKRNCVWYFVERVEDVSTVTHAQSTATPQRYRIAAGETCPETGFYFTPARPDSRRLFQQGDVMPAFDTAYGATIWQWDSIQD